MFVHHLQIVSPGVRVEGMDVDGDGDEEEEEEEEVEGGDSPVIKIQPEQ